MVEKITGVPIEETMARELFAPLGMTISSYVWEERFDELAAAGHDKTGAVKPDRPLFTRANAGYSLYCTPREYALFLLEIMKRDRTAPHSLSAASINAMLTPITEATGRKPITRGGRTLSASVHWGLGWPINTTEWAERIYHSGSNGPGFRCYCEFDRARASGIVIMTNSINGRALWEQVIAELGTP